MKFKFESEPYNRFAVRVKVKTPNGEVMKKMHFTGGTWHDTDDLCINMLFNGEVVKMPIDQEYFAQQIQIHNRNGKGFVKIKDDDDDIPVGQILDTPEPYDSDDEPKKKRGK